MLNSINFVPTIHSYKFPFGFDRNSKHLDSIWSPNYKEISKNSSNNIKSYSKKYIILFF
jgi:hypothetical protein